MSQVTLSQARVNELVDGLNHKMTSVMKGLKELKWLMVTQCILVLGLTIKVFIG